MAEFCVAFALAGAFLLGLWVIWLRSGPSSRPGLPPQDQPPVGTASVRVPLQRRRRERYVSRGLDDLEAWLQSTDPDPET